MDGYGKDRYQVITYTFGDGYDERLTYRTIKAALSLARVYFNVEGYDGAAVYDLQTKTIKRTLGYFPEL